MNVSIVSAPCPLGCQDQDEIVFYAHDRLHNLPGEYAVVRCNRCGLMRTNPRPTPDTIGFYYPDDYGPYQTTKVASATSSAGGEGIRSVARRLLHKFVEYNAQRVPNTAPGSMLEFGCASGSFLHVMAGRGWDVQGIEFSPSAAEAASSLGYRVHTGSIETAPNPGRKFDLIVGWMVLEHLHEPIVALGKLREWIEDEGWLVVSVPDIDAVGFRLFRDTWYPLHVPAHLYHFTPRTLRAVLAAAGWTVEKVFYQRVLTDYVVSLGYALRDRHRLPRLAEFLVERFPRSGLGSLALYPLAYPLSRMGQTGRITVWARRTRKAAE
ncbi:Methyltransferase type 12 [Thiocapsa sp. KS1]|nr:class I SAM-dependent methyltransferase [Thiocapsa sp. KS1]CRI64468.1 Methyltransferase type 12 [Thiocapsa sp. KS1]